MIRIRSLGFFLFLAIVAPTVVAQEQTKQPAQIRVLLPADATLQIDNYQTKEQTGPVRVFMSPPLEPGKKYAYTLKATWLQDSRTVVRMGIATVEAGKETQLDLRQDSKDATSSQIVYVPTPQEVVDKMIDMAKVQKEDVVFDLGCGDGRIVATTAKKFGAKGVGVDIDPERIKECQVTLKTMQVPEGFVDIRQADALKVKDLSKATVVMLYMLPEFMKQLEPILERDLKPGTRVVAHDYAVPGWTAKQTERMTTTRIYPHVLYLYVIGEKK